MAFSLLLTLLLLLAGKFCGANQYSEVRLLSARQYAEKYQVPHPLLTNNRHTAGRLLFSWDFPAKKPTVTTESSTQATKTTENFPVTTNKTKQSRNNLWWPQTNNVGWLRNPTHYDREKKVEEVLIKEGSKPEISPLSKEDNRNKKKRGKKTRKRKYRKKHFKKPYSTMDSNKVLEPKFQNYDRTFVFETTTEAKLNSAHKQIEPLEDGSRPINSKSKENNKNILASSFKGLLKIYKPRFKYHQHNTDVEDSSNNTRRDFLLHNRNNGIKTLSVIQNQTMKPTNANSHDDDISNELRNYIFKASWKLPILLMARKNYSGDDVNECIIDNGGCEGLCINIPGSYRCHCPPGFRLDSLKCLDVNECVARNGHGPCQSECTNMWGSYRCSCERLPGTRLADDGISCEDIDECTSADSRYQLNCSHGCVNTLGSAFCLCPAGYSLGSDWRTCQDIDECDLDELQTIKCEQKCVNTVGSYYCL